jgi:hypothetical protein
MVANEEGARLLVYERETNDVTGGGAQQQQQQTLTKDAFCCSLI